MSKLVKTIELMLDSTIETGSKNTLSLEKIRGWLLEHLQAYEAELKRFPEAAKEPHFDLIMADFDFSRDALFVAAVFDIDSVSFVAGRGNAALVRQFAETDFPENVRDTITDLRRRFAVLSPSSIVSKRELDNWLGRRTSF